VASPCRRCAPWLQRAAHGRRYAASIGADKHRRVASAIDSTASGVRFMFRRWPPPTHQPADSAPAVLASPLHELAGFYLAIDCLALRCNGERTFAVAELAAQGENLHQEDVGEVINLAQQGVITGPGAAFLAPRGSS
jgi:hypothetical protein